METEIGAAAEDYLKRIYALSREGSKATPALLAERLKVSAPAVTKMVKKLQHDKLVRYERGAGLELTARGQRIALEVLRHHRLLERFLHDHLGYGWDEVHEEAERLEHVISARFEERLVAVMGDPATDPHGDPIPRPDGSLVPRREVSLETIEVGGGGMISRVANHDPEMLRYLGRLGLFPGVRIRVVGIEPYGGSWHLRIDNRQFAIGRELTRHIFLTLEEHA